MKICHVCSAHDADDGRVFHRACVSLARAGFDVHLIASSEATAPYRRQGVTIHPLPVAGSRRERFARRASIARLAVSLDPDLYHVHEPELLGAVLKRAGSRPVIWDVHESYLDVLMARDWIPRWIRPAARIGWDWRERRLLDHCGGVVVVTEPIAKRYRELHPHVRVVGNYPPRPTDSVPEGRRGDARTCVFAGSLMPDRGLHQVIDALGLLRERGLRVNLALAGRPMSEEFLAGLFTHASERGVRDQVSYHGVLSKEEVRRFQGSAGIGLVTYLPSPNSVAGLPNKLLECMSLGLPVIFSKFPVYVEIAGESGAGLPVDPTNPSELASAIETLVQDPHGAALMGERGFRAVRDRFNWEVEWPKLRELYDLLLGPRRNPAIARESAETPVPVGGQSFSA